MFALGKMFAVFSISDKKCEEYMAGLSRLWEQLSALHVMINQMMDWARAASPTRARPVPAPAPPLPAPAVALP